MKSVWTGSAELVAEGTPFVVVTLVSSRGHAPQDPGAKALVTAKGLQAGTVGGGKVEARAIAFAQELLAERAMPGPTLVTWNLQKDIGMTCGGEVTYLFEGVRQDSWKVVVFGAGHVAQALVRALGSVEARVFCVDPRPEWIGQLPAHPSLKTLLLEKPETFVESTSGDEFFVVITQGHATDVPVLEAIFRRYPRPRYVGVIGSETKGLKIKSELKARGVPESSLSLLRIPIGLPIGTNHPGEIAISILAELIQVRDAWVDESPKP
jgi:xanthine dehydrogenase accessory factor